MGALPDVLPGYQSVADITKREKIAEMWGIPELPTEVGLTVVEMMNAILDRKIRAIYIIGENPLLSDPDISHVKQALCSVDFLVVQDIFLTETAQLAHVVLPAACWAEKDGTFTATDRRVQRIRKAVDPPGQSKPDWEIICELGKAMGAGNLFSFGSAKEVFEELRKVTPLYAGITYDRIDHPDGLQWPCPSEDHPGTPILHLKQFTRGKGKFQPVSHKEPEESQDSGYPYLLTTGRVETQWHTGSMTRRSPALNDECPEPYVEINPEDAQRLGIADGEEIEILSKRGRIRTKVLITDKVTPGVIFMPFHFAESAANLLTYPALDPIAKIPVFKVCAAAVRRIEW
jgi:predicted molibdopterin-dependent oxidoreductase YjgC